MVRIVREADIVELDLVKAHGLHCVDSQRDFILPDIAAEGTRPVAGCDIQRLAGAVGNGVLGMILAEEGIVEGCQTADHIESCVLDFLNDCLIICDGVLGVLIRRGGIFLVHRRIVADGRAIHDVDDEGIDLRGLCVFDILVDVLQDRRVARQIDGVAGVRHFVVCKIGLGAREIVEAFRVAAAPFVAASGVDGIDAEAVIDVVGLLQRR